jgi:hypothetical protein
VRERLRSMPGTRPADGPGTGVASRRNWPHKFLSKKFNQLVLDLFRPGDVMLADRLMCAWTEMVMLQQRGVGRVCRGTRRNESWSKVFGRSRRHSSDTPP